MADYHGEVRQEETYQAAGIWRVVQALTVLDLVGQVRDGGRWRDIPYDDMTPREHGIAEQEENDRNKAGCLIMVVGSLCAMLAYALGQ